MKYNLKLSVSCLLALLAAAPFVYYLVRPIDGFRMHYKAELLASALTLPVFLLLSFSPRFARLCARRPERVAETSATAFCTSCIVFIILVLSVIGEVERWFSISPAARAAKPYARQFQQELETDPRFKNIDVHLFELKDKGPIFISGIVTSDADLAELHQRFQALHWPAGVDVHWNVFVHANEIGVPK
jgi:hypothetical protein